MTLKQDLKALQREFKALGKKVEKLTKVVEKAEKTQAKAAKAKTLKKAPAKKKAPVKKKAAAVKMIPISNSSDLVIFFIIKSCIQMFKSDSKARKTSNLCTSVEMAIGVNH